MISAITTTNKFSNPYVSVVVVHKSWSRFIQESRDLKSHFYDAKQLYGPEYMKQVSIGYGEQITVIGCNQVAISYYSIVFLIVPIAIVQERIIVICLTVATVFIFTTAVAITMRQTILEPVPVMNNHRSIMPTTLRWYLCLCETCSCHTVTFYDCHIIATIEWIWILEKQAWMAWQLVKIWLCVVWWLCTCGNWESWAIILMRWISITRAHEMEQQIYTVMIDYVVTLINVGDRKWILIP